MHRFAPLCVPVIAVLLSFSGCATGPEVVSPDSRTHTISAEDTLQWNASTVPARQLVFEQASRYCAKRKLVMVPVSLDLRPGEIGVKTGKAHLVFLAVPPGDPAIARTQAILRQYDPMVVRESVVRFDADGTEHLIATRP